MLRKLMVLSTALFLPLAANAATAIITDGNVSLGVDEFGQLNVGGGVADVYGTTAVGVRWLDGGLEYESTSHGCLCEGWGLAVGGVSGYANNDTGKSGLALVGGASGFTSTATTASSIVNIIGTDVNVTHSFALASETDNLYRVTVKVENTGASAATGLVYRRVMDWDTSPTPFNEYVTIGGTATTGLLLASSSDGFQSGDPLAPITDGFGCGLTADFTACGPKDHGAAFDFSLADLAAGASYTFDIYYGGAANEREAYAALSAVDAELFSFGWSGKDADQNGFDDVTGARTPTFIFAFSGVGGVVVEPPEVPVPAAGLMLLGGLGMMAGLRKRKAA